MSTRLDLPGASVLPFQFPQLKDSGPREIAAPPPTGEVAPVTLPNGRGGDAEAIAAEFAKAHAEGLQRGLEEGQAKGFAAGHAEGLAAAEEAMSATAGRLGSLLVRFGGPIAALEQPVEEALVALALEIARCVIGSEVRRSHEFLVRLVREAIAKVPLEMGSPRVLLNPADLELIRKLVPEAEAGHATLVADDTVEAGGCLVIADGETNAGKDRRWNPRTSEGVSQVNLTLPSRWRAVMLTLFDGEDG